MASFSVINCVFVLSKRRYGPIAVFLGSFFFVLWCSSFYVSLVWYSLSFTFFLFPFRSLFFGPPLVLWWGSGPRGHCHLLRGVCAALALLCVSVSLVIRLAAARTLGLVLCACVFVLVLFSGWFFPSAVSVRVLAVGGAPLGRLRFLCSWCCASLRVCWVGFAFSFFLVLVWAGLPASVSVKSICALFSYEHANSI